MNRLDPQYDPERGTDSAMSGTPMPRRDYGDPMGGPSTFDAWKYRDETTVTGAQLVGYKVEAMDGSIGKIDRESREVDSSYLVVDTGPWIFGKKVMLPAGVVDRVDHDEQKVYVDRTKDQIKAAPEFDEDSHADPAYRDKLGGYYGDTYGMGDRSGLTPGDTYGQPGSPIPPPRT